MNANTCPSCGVVLGAFNRDMVSGKCVSCAGGATKVTVTSAVDGSFPFVCSSCGCRATAQLSDLARASSTVRGGDGAARAAGAAQAQANAAAVAQSRMKMKTELAPCPRCGKRNASAVQSHFIRSGLWALGCAAVAVGATMAVVFAHASLSVGLIFLLALAALITGVMAIAMLPWARKLYNEAPSEVRFSDIR